MYDYVDGKVDWMAYGLPVEGDDGPFIGQQVSDVTTCGIAATVGDARRALGRAAGDRVVAVDGGLAVGVVDDDALAGRADDAPVLDVMAPVPSTYRPSVTFAALAEDGGDGRFLVSTPDGRLLGEVTVEAGADAHAGHDHAGGTDFDLELDEVMAAIGERFGDQPPTEDELRSFLHDRMVAEGRSPEEADRALDQLGGSE